MSGCGRWILPRAVTVQPDPLDTELSRRSDIVKPATGDVSPLAGADARRARKEAEMRRRRLVVAHPLGRHDEIERLAEGEFGPGEEVIVAVGQYGEAAPHRAEPASIGSTSSNSGKVPHESGRRRVSAS